MKVIIPVAGGGTRLWPLTQRTPKVLLQVADRPMLGHILEQVEKVEPEEVIFIIGAGGDAIVNYVVRTFDFPVRFVEQTDLIGLGYAVALASPFFGRGPLLVILGDTLIGADLKKIMNIGHDALGVKEVDDPERFGIAEVTRGVITRLVEKPQEPQSNLALVGLYFIRSVELFSNCLAELLAGGVRTGGEYQLTDALQKMIERGCQFRSFPIHEWLDCGKPETLLATNRHLLRNGSDNAGPKTKGIIPPVFVAPDAVVTGSRLGPFVSIGSRARIKDAVLADVICGSEASVSGVTLEHAIVGNGATVHGQIPVRKTKDEILLIQN